MRIILLGISLLLVGLVNDLLALSKVFLDLLIGRSRSLHPGVAHNFADAESGANIILHHASDEAFKLFGVVACALGSLMLLPELV